MEDDCFNIAVKTATYQKGSYAYPQITLTTGSDEESATTTLTPFTHLHKGHGMEGLFDALSLSFKDQGASRMARVYYAAILFGDFEDVSPITKNLALQMK